jgi:hypothetical protein
LGRARGQSFDHRDIRMQLRRQTMPVAKVFGAVVRDPDRAGGIFRDQNLQWQIDGNAWLPDGRGRS